MKLWLLAFGALSAIAAYAAYTFANRRNRPRGRFTDDQVSSEWLTTAKIHHEDHQ